MSRRRNPEEEEVADNDIDLLNENEDADGLDSLESSEEEEAGETEDALLDCMEDLLDEVKGLREDIRGALGAE